MLPTSKVKPGGKPTMAVYQTAAKTKGLPSNPPVKDAGTQVSLPSSRGQSSSSPDSTIAKLMGQSKPASKPASKAASKTDSPSKRLSKIIKFESAELDFDYSPKSGRGSLKIITKDKETELDVSFNLHHWEVKCCFRTRFCTLVTLLCGLGSLLGLTYNPKWLEVIFGGVASHNHTETSSTVPAVPPPVIDLSYVGAPPWSKIIFAYQTTRTTLLVLQRHSLTFIVASDLHYFLIWALTAKNVRMPLIHQLIHRGVSIILILFCMFVFMSSGTDIGFEAGLVAMGIAILKMALVPFEFFMERRECAINT